MKQKTTKEPKEPKNRFYLKVNFTKNGHKLFNAVK